MKTTTNTTPAARIADPRAVMTRAHALTRRTLEQWPAADYRVTFAAALRIAWEDATAPAAADAWNAKTPEEQIDALTRMTYKAASRDLAGTDRRGNPRADRFAWARTKELTLDRAAVEPIVNEAYARLIPYLYDEKHADKPLATLLYQAVVTAAQAINRAEKRNARAVKWADVVTGEDDDGKETTERIARIVDNAAPNAERFPAPEKLAMLHDTITSLPRDDIDRAILAGMLKQYSRRDIADTLGLSHTAVNKRVNAMIARYAADHLNDA